MTEKNWEEDFLLDLNAYVDWEMGGFEEAKIKLSQRETEIRKEERQFMLNILDGIDEADRQLGHPGGTKAIRFALKNRI